MTFPFFKMRLSGHSDNNKNIIKLLLCCQQQPDLSCELHNVQLKVKFIADLTNEYIFGIACTSLFTY